MAVKYCTEIGPDGSGHNRCGPACLAYTLIREGWDSDPFQLTMQMTYDVLGIRYPEQMNTAITLPNGASCDELIGVLARYGKSARPIFSFDDAVKAMGTGVMILLLDNWYIRPRAYPMGDRWDAAHFVAVDRIISDDCVVLNDPLCYVPGEYPKPYQGFTTASISSLRTAVAATPSSWYVGIAVG